MNKDDMTPDPDAAVEDAPEADEAPESEDGEDGGDEESTDEGE